MPLLRARWPRPPLHIPAEAARLRSGSKSCRHAGANSWCNSQAFGCWSGTARCSFLSGKESRVLPASALRWTKRWAREHPAGRGMVGADHVNDLQNRRLQACTQAMNADPHNCPPRCCAPGRTDGRSTVPSEPPYEPCTLAKMNVPGCIPSCLVSVQAPAAGWWWW
jgi:hypothetical protein